MKRGKYIRTKKIKEKNRIASTGKKHTFQEIEKQKQNQPKKYNCENPMWKGDNVGYHALHAWVKRHCVKSKLCECCKKVPPYDLANKGIYNRELKNWEWLCRKCHMKKDGRLKNFYKTAARSKKGKLNPNWQGGKNKKS